MLPLWREPGGSRGGSRGFRCHSMPRTSTIQRGLIFLWAPVSGITMQGKSHHGWHTGAGRKPWLAWPLLPITYPYREAASIRGCSRFLAPLPSLPQSHMDLSPQLQLQLPDSHSFLHVFSSSSPPPYEAYPSLTLHLPDPSYLPTYLSVLWLTGMRLSMHTAQATP